MADYRPRRLLMSKGVSRKYLNERKKRALLPSHDTDQQKKMDVKEESASTLLPPVRPCQSDEEREELFSHYVTQHLYRGDAGADICVLICRILDVMANRVVWFVHWKDPRERKFIVEDSLLKSYGPYQALLIDYYTEESRTCYLPCRLDILPPLNLVLLDYTSPHYLPHSTCLHRSLIESTPVAFDPSLPASSHQEDFRSAGPTLTRSLPSWSSVDLSEECHILTPLVRPLDYRDCSEKKEEVEEMVIWTRDPNDNRRPLQEDETVTMRTTSLH